MAGRGTARQQETRRRIAVEAARLISESGLRDYGHAKRKAAERLGIFDDTGLPANRDIEEALREHQRLFRGDAQAHTLRRLRKAARDAMRFFSSHEPRLVGAVLEGTADEHSAVCLHLYSDRPHEVIALLQEHGIPYDEQDRRIRLDQTTTRDYPGVRFSAGDTSIDLTLLPYDLLRQAPLDRISERPMRRAGLDAIEALLADRA
ncbi:MAG: hypothetical protein ACHP7D_00015 [Lysobacterales bacterium]